MAPYPLLTIATRSNQKDNWDMTGETSHLQIGTLSKPPQGVT
jgi:hypothetical protein